MNAIPPIPRPAIDRSGVYDLRPEVYHADPVVTPSLSASIASLMLTKSPAHVCLAHPRLNPDFQPKHSTTFELGSAVHKLVLGKGAELLIIEADNYQKKVAQQERDAAREQGMIPILAHQYAEALDMAAAIRAQLARHEIAGAAFEAGKPEQTIVWQEGGTWCRLMLDWLPEGGNVFIDLKTTGASANPDDWSRRQLYDIGADVQAAFYRRGIRAVLGIPDPHFWFCVCENEEPYALSVVSLTPAALHMADRKVEEALGWWRWCLENNRWPGYPGRVCYVDPPVWEEKRWLEREERAQLHGTDELRKIALEWQRPLLENSV